MTGSRLERAGRGVAVTLASSSVVMTGAIGAQVVLGFLLSERDFGIYAIAFAFSDFVMVFRDGGINRWIARLGEDEFERGAQDALIVSFVCSSIAGGVIALLALPVGYTYGEQSVTEVMLYIAPVLPLGAYTVVASARLQVHLRFGALAWMKLGSGIVRYTMLIGAAWWGFGALCFAFALIAAALFELLFHLIVTRQPVVLREMSLSGARALFRKSGWSLTGSYAMAVLRQADYAVLGLFARTETVGVYYFAFQLARKPVLLLSESLRRVVMPVLARVSPGSKGEARGMQLAGALLGAIATPLLLGLTVVAPALLDILWGDRWDSAARPLQIFMLAMPFYLFSLFVEAMTQARGQFRAWTGGVVARGLGFAVCAVFAAWASGGDDLQIMAAIMAGYTAASSLALSAILLGHQGVRRGDLLRPFIGPALGTAFVAVAAAILAEGVVLGPIVEGLLFGACYYATANLLSYVFFRKPFREAWRYTSGLIRRRSRATGDSK